MSSRKPQTRLFPVTRSILSTAALMSEVLLDYDIAAPVECKFLAYGLNDTYLVRTVDERYILRVYRSRWRSLADIDYELEALTHLDRKGVPVAAPIARKDGAFLRQLNAPEGVRLVALFGYANGRELSQDQEQNYLYGRAAAAIHVAADSFVSRHARFQLDLPHLLDQPLAAIQPFLAHRPDDWAYLQSLANRVRDRIASLPIEQLEWGFCHGDLHGGNAHIDERKTITFFDFDAGGSGWRAYDIAAFRQGPWGRQDEAWEAFLKGYTERRKLSELDLAAVPWFVALRHIWLMGLHTGNSQDWGCGWMNDAYFDGGGAGGLKFLREWEAKYLNGEEKA
jgi:Ser/Thr protein kinase RdoA (MazF antagonist)